MSHHQWYYGTEAGQRGPVDEATLRAAMASGEIPPTAMVWREGMPDWAPLAAVPELQRAVEAMPATLPGPVQALPGGAPPTSGLAIASMVCGIVGLLMCYLAALAAIPAVICGHMALANIRKAPHAVSGSGMAIAGLITGYLGLTISLASIAFVIFAIVAGSTSA